jgi:Zn-dependent peptidase ImmA (M78 family)/DNA-binding XRE family transcriptional regulator
MKEIFSKRLKSARTLAALSQDQLVEKMGNIVSKNAISKYEKGQMMPDSAILLTLSKALNVKPDYFFRPFTVEIENVEFRKKQKLSVKKLNAIKQTVSDFIERYIEVEQFLNITAEFVNPIQHMGISNINDIEKAALQVRSKWKLGLNALPNVIDLLEDNEVKVVEIDAPDEFDGFSGWADGKIPIIVINKNYIVERKRLTALHELGHLILNLDANISDREKEKFCFRFAGAMLIPEPTFKFETGNVRSHFYLPELIAVKETYGISLQAIMARAKDLQIINESQFIAFRKWISHNRTEEGLGHYKGSEHTYRFKQLIFRAAAEEVISLSKAANLSNQKLAEFRKEFVAL